MERFFARKAAVDGNQTADPAGHTGFHGIPEAACYLSPVVKAPIRQDPEDIAINGWRTILLHYQRACESPSLLLQGVGMWVIPESPGIRRGKFVEIGRASCRERECQYV